MLCADGVKFIQPLLEATSLKHALARCGHSAFAVDASTLLDQKLPVYAACLLAGDWTGFDSAVEVAFTALSVTLEGTEPVFVFSGRRASPRNSHDETYQTAIAELATLTEQIRRLEAKQSQLAAESKDADEQSAAAARRLEAAMEKKLSEAKDTQRAVEARAAAALLPAASQRAIATCRRRGFEFVVAPGEAEHQMHALQLAGHVGVVVCAPHSNLVATGCNHVVFSSLLWNSNVSCLNWASAKRRLRFTPETFSFVADDEHLDADRDTVNNVIKEAMCTYGVESVSQLTCLYLLDGSGSSNVSLVTVAKAWRSLLAEASGFAPTLSSLAAHMVAVQPELILKQLVHAAERAAFLLYCQVAALIDIEDRCCLVVGKPPAFTSGCTEELLRAPWAATGDDLPMYAMQHRSDNILLNQHNFFSQLTKEQLRNWAAGEYDTNTSSVSDLRPSHVPLFPAPAATASADDMATIVERWSEKYLRAAAGHLHVPVEELSLSELRDMVKTAIELHAFRLSPTALEEKLSSNQARVTLLNRSKREASRQARENLAKLQHYVELPRAHFDDTDTLKKWQEMDPLPAAGAQLSARELARCQIAKFNRLAVEDDGHVGYLHVTVQASTPAIHFREVIVKVGFEERYLPSQLPCPDYPATISSILDIVCLTPEGAATEDVSPQTLSSTDGDVADGVPAPHYCYGGAFCVHGMAVVHALHFAARASVPKCYKHRIGRELPATLEYMFGLPMSSIMFDVEPEAVTAANFNPLTPEDCALIDMGIGPNGDPVYRGRVLELREVLLHGYGVEALRIDPVLDSDSGPHVVYGSGAIPPPCKGTLGAARQATGEGTAAGHVGSAKETAPDSTMTDAMDVTSDSATTDGAGAAAAATPIYSSCEVQGRLGDCVLRLQTKSDLGGTAGRMYFLEAVEDTNTCRTFTGMLNYGVLEALFQYLDARGALSGLTRWYEDPKYAPLDEQKLTPFEAFVLFSSLLRQGTTNMRMAAWSFGVSTHTAKRIFKTVLRAVAYIFGKHQPWPSAEAMRKACSQETREMLQLADDTIVLWGGSTRFTADSHGRGDDGGPDMKVNTLILCNKYMVEVTKSYSSRTPENQLLAADGTATRIRRATAPHVPVLLSHDGVARTPDLASNNVELIRPFGNRIYGTELGDARQCGPPENKKRIGAYQCAVMERFREMKQFEAFGDFEGCAVNVVEMDLIAAVVRGYVNLRPAHNVQEDIHRAREA